MSFSSAAAAAASSSAAAASSAVRATSSGAASSRAASSASATRAASSVAASASSATSSAVSSSSSSAASSVAPSSSASHASSASSASSSSSQSSSSSGSSGSSASSATAIIGASSQTASSSSSSGLSGGAIGGIVGGIVGGIILLVLAWTLWRTCRDRRHRVPPPPPREVSYVPHSLSRQRVVSSGMLSTKDMNRQSTYSANTALAGRPSSTYASHSRQPSYSTTLQMPIQTAAVFNHDGSPPMPPSTSSNSPPLSAEGTVSTTPRKKPSLPLLSTGNLQREGSTSTASGSNSNPSEMGQIRPVPSIDRLRRGAERAPSPPVSDPGSSRTTSPFPPSSPGGSSTIPRASFAHSLSPGLNQGQFPRPGSMASLSSQRATLGPGGRPVQLQMPQLLGARPDATGDFFWGTNRVPSEGFNLGGLAEMGQASRMPSMQNMSVRLGQGQGSQGQGIMSESGRQERPADPKVVLRREGA